MAKTILPNKQLELPIMVNLKQRADRQAASPEVEMAAAPPVPSPTHAQFLKQVAEATAVDLSVYDAISSNYVRSDR